MAVLCRSVNPRAATRIKPEMKPVTFIESGFATPRKLLFSLNPCLHGNAIGVPANPDIGKKLAIGEFRETRDLEFLREIDSLLRPLSVPSMQGNFDAKE